MEFVVEEQPFDGELLRSSRLYRKSRELFTKGGGRFRAALVSPGRALTSHLLLENVIEYTPLASELKWALTDKIERRNPRAVAELKRYSSSLFHEQNHRILWRALPPPPSKRDALRRYLNFAESLVIVTDMALSDELGLKRASEFHRFGVIYDPGTDIRRVLRNARSYRNYLQACLHATYMQLELFEDEIVAKVIESLYSNVEPRILRRAIERAANLNKGFITQTNLVWQKRHAQSVAKVFGRKSARSLELVDNPVNNIEQYKLAEAWFDLLGL